MKSCSPLGELHNRVTLAAPDGMPVTLSHDHYGWRLDDGPKILAIGEPVCFH